MLSPLAGCMVGTYSKGCRLILYRLAITHPPTHTPLPGGKSVPVRQGDPLGRMRSRAPVASTLAPHLPIIPASAGLFLGKLTRRGSRGSHSPTELLASGTMDVHLLCPGRAMTGHSPWVWVLVATPLAGSALRDHLQLAWQHWMPRAAAASARVAAARPVVPWTGGTTVAAAAVS